VADDGLVAGQTYTFRWFAVNARGPGSPSTEIKVACVDPLAAPTGLTKVDSSSSSITMQWDTVVPANGNVLGYKLFLIDDSIASTELVFNGSEQG
jgi:hypothetical protein